MSFTKKSEKVIEKKMDELKEKQKIAEQDSAPDDWVKNFLSKTKRKMKHK